MIKKPLKYCLLIFFTAVILNGELPLSNMYEINNKCSIITITQGGTYSSFSVFSVNSISVESTSQSNHEYHFNNFAQLLYKGTTIDISQILLGGRIKLELQI